MPRPARVILVASLALLWAWTVHAAASCAYDPRPLSDRISAAPAAFVGRVVRTTDLRRTAIVDVQEVWKGSNVPHEAIVHGSPFPIRPNVYTSIDRNYGEGATYLFVPDARDGSAFTESSCSATTEFTTRVAAQRPAGTKAVAEAAPDPPMAPAEPENRFLPITLAAAAVACIAAAYWIAWRRGFTAGIRPAL